MFKQIRFAEMVDPLLLTLADHVFTTRVNLVLTCADHAYAARADSVCTARVHPVFAARADPVQRHRDAAGVEVHRHGAALRHNDRHAHRGGVEGSLLQLAVQEHQETRHHGGVWQAQGRHREVRASEMEAPRGEGKRKGGTER